MDLSPHFTLHELTVSEYAARNGIANVPMPEDIVCLSELCMFVLEPLRRQLQKPVNVTSGFRSVELNRAIGGAENSQHCRGQAADIHVKGMSTESLFQTIIKSGIEFDQCILEFNSWVHISWNTGKNRKELLVAEKINGKTTYRKP